MSTNIIEIPYAGDHISNYYDIEREKNKAYYGREGFDMKFELKKPSANTLLTVASLALGAVSLVVSNAKEANEMKKLGETVKEEVIKELSNK